jgi:hypothetical protein
MKKARSPSMVDPERMSPTPSSPQRRRLLFRGDDDNDNNAAADAIEHAETMHDETTPTPATSPPRGEDDGNEATGAMAMNDAVSPTISAFSRLTVSDRSLGAIEKVSKTLKDAYEEMQANRVTGGGPAPYDVRFSDELVVDATSLALYDHPKTWPKSLQAKLKAHLDHNIHDVVEVLKCAGAPVAVRQVVSFFSSETESIVILDYPPQAQVGKKCNLAFSAHKSLKKETGTNAVKIYSNCITMYAHQWAKTTTKLEWGKTIGVVASNPFGESLDDDVCTIELVQDAYRALFSDWIERHPTFTANNVDPAALIEEHLGADHLRKGDQLFADFVYARAEYVRSRAMQGLQSAANTLCPVISWNAGQFDVHGPRSGALAPLYVEMEKRGVSPLHGIHHPQFLAHTKNPHVRLGASAYDFAMVSAAEDAGLPVMDNQPWSGFIGVKDLTDEEREALRREVSELAHALGLLAWRTEGKSGSRKNEFFVEFRKSFDQEEACYLAQLRCITEGQIQAAMRMFNIDAEQLSQLSDDELKTLQHSYLVQLKVNRAARWKGLSEDQVASLSITDTGALLAEYRFVVNVCAAARWKGLTEAQVAALTEDEARALVEEHRFQGALNAAARWKGLTEAQVAALTEDEARALVEEHRFQGALNAAARWKGLTEAQVAALTEDEARALVEEHRFQGALNAAARWKGLTEAQVAALTEDEARALVEEHRFQGALNAAARWKGLTEAQVAALTEDEARALVEEHRFQSALNAAARWKGLTEAQVAALTEDEARALVEEHRFQGALNAAARWKGLTEAQVAALTEDEARALVEEHRFQGALNAAARWKGLTEAQVAALTEDEARALVEEHRFQGALNAAARWKGLTEAQVAALTEDEARALVEEHRFQGALNAAARWKGLTEAQVAALTEDEARALVEEHRFQGALNAAARWKGLSDDQLNALSADDARALEAAYRHDCRLRAAVEWKGLDVAEASELSEADEKTLIGEHSFVGQLLAAAKWRGLSEEDVSKMTMEQLREVAKEHRNHGKLQASLAHFPEVTADEVCDWSDERKRNFIQDYEDAQNARKAKSYFGVSDEEFEKLPTFERRELVKNYNISRRAELLGYSIDDVKELTHDERKDIRNHMNKRLLVEKLGLKEEADEGDEDDDDDEADEQGDGGGNELSFITAMELTLGQLQELVAMATGGMSKKKLEGITYAMKLGVPREDAMELGADTLDRCRVFSRREVRLQRRQDQGFFFTPGSAGHDAIVGVIDSFYIANGVRLMVTEHWDASQYAFNVMQSSVTDPLRATKYGLYRREQVTIPAATPESEPTIVNIWMAKHAEVRKASGKTEHATKSAPESAAALAQYFFTIRAEVVKNLHRDTLNSMVPRQSFNTNALAIAARLQRQVEANEEGLFFFADSERYEAFMKELADKPTAKFRRNDKRINERLAFQFWQYIRRDTGKIRIDPAAYYRDDDQIWRGPEMDWGAGVPKGRKLGQTAIINALNALAARFDERENQETTTTQ